jgi:UDP-3-O-[3-hydroxymyristoyl] N-acetylglucosamine deacetylase
MKDVEALKRMGLARGGSFDNAVVLDDALVLNPEGLRFADEFVRHKILDAIGDFKLAGIQLQGCFRLHRTGHDVHRQLLEEIFSSPDNYEILEGLAPVQPGRLSRSLLASATEAVSVGAAASRRRAFAAGG